MTVTSEDKVLDAILLWCMQACEVCGWATVDELMSSSTPEQIFGDRLHSLESLLPFVRFPLMSLHLLEKVCSKSSRINLNGCSCELWNYLMSTLRYNVRSWQIAVLASTFLYFISW